MEIGKTEAAVLTIKEYLSQAFKLDKHIKAKESRIRDLRDMQTRVSGYSEVRVQTSPTDTMAKLTAELVDLINECQQDIMRLLDIQREIAGIISTVKCDDHRLILYERYVNLKRWEDIAADNGYTWKWVHVLHNRGLAAVKEYMEIHGLNVA
jgi:hypothetical protein